MLIILFSIFAATSYIYFNAISLRKTIKVIESVKESHANLVVFDYSKTLVYINLIAALTSLVFGILSYKESDVNLAIGIALGGSFVGQALVSLSNRRLYYNKLGFIGGGRFVRYKSIKEFAQFRRLMMMVNIVTYSGEQIRLPIKAAQIIKKMKEEL